MPEVTKEIAEARGYLAIKTRTRGAVGRGRRKAHNAASKASWAMVGRYYHATLRPKRFTPKHAEEAGYTKRKGENLPKSSGNFRRSYYGRKYYDPLLGGGRNQADPLVKTGQAKKRARMARISETSKGARVAYPGLGVFNYRHPQSRVQMGVEFRRITRREVPELAEQWDENYDKIYNENDK